MEVTGLSLFETPIEPCVIAGSEHGLKGVQLPEADDARARVRMCWPLPSAPEAAPPQNVCAAADRIAALLRDDLCDIAPDMSAVPPFERRVYECVCAVAPGATLSYGDVAARLGEPGTAARWDRRVAGIRSLRSCRAIPC